MSGVRRFIDIGANLTDLMYNGTYNGSKKHDPDLSHVLNRSWAAGLDKIIVTGGNLEESKKALEIANSDDRLFSTVGCHPTRCSEFEEKAANRDEYLEGLKKVILDGKDKIVAIGECGLDYDRVQFCPKDTQKRYFQFQLQLVEFFKLPLFLHCRNASEDLHQILSKHNFKGVIHSFDATFAEAKKFLDLGYHVGLNGCSLKTEENLETVRQLPVDRILLETDCPWCEIRPSHAGFEFVRKEHVSSSVKKEKWNEGATVKGRNEPCNIRQVLDVIAAVRDEDSNKLCEQIYENTINVFFNK